MVKSPKIRHSKQRTEPVTIDLSADEVKREAAKPGDAGADKTGGSSAKSATGAAAGGKTNPDMAAQASGDAPQAKSAAASASSFGRSPGNSPQPSDGASAKDGGAAAKSPPKQSMPRRGRGGVLVAGLAGGIVALAAAIALYTSGYLPSPPASPPDNTAIDRLEADLAALSDEIAALKSAPPAAEGGELGTALAETNSRVENMAVMVEGLRAEIGELADTVAAGGAGDGAGIAALQERLVALEETVAALPETGGDTEAVSAELSRIAGEVTSLRTALDAASAETDSRIAAIEQGLASLGERLDEQEQNPGVALAIAASALKAAIDRGQPFTTELETFAQLAPDASEIEALRGYAASGVPTAAAIASETEPAAVRMIDAARPQNTNAGLLDRLWASAEALITVRPIGAVEGDDVPAIVARMEAAIKSGDYAAAIGEYETLPEAAQAAGAELMAKVRARQAADELVSKALAAALRA